jgi:hypothetical protein
MSRIKYGLGRFNDRRLEKGGPRCIKPWCFDLDAVSGGSAARAHGKCSSRGSCATRR